MKFIYKYAIILIFLTLFISCGNQTTENYHAGFEIHSVDKTLHNELLSKNIFGNHSPIPIERLSLLKVKYYDFDKNEHTGKIMVLDACSKQVQNIFVALYQKKFPINKMVLVTEYNGNDSLSMADNNTSSHNLRQITGGQRWSLHAYGTAIDINPINNPFIDIPCKDSLGIVKFQPIAGIKYANRMENRLGKTNREGMAEEVIDIFAKNGFYWWGGYWNCPIDYQHFQISRSITELLAAMTSEEAIQFFQVVVDYYNKNNLPIEDAIELKIGEEITFKDFYKGNPEKFWKFIEQIM